MLARTLIVDVCSTWIFLLMRLRVKLMYLHYVSAELPLKLRDFGLGGAETIRQIRPLNFCFKSFRWIHEESLSASQYISLGHRCSVKELLGTEILD
jgi:hypothetical protein